MINIFIDTSGSMSEMGKDSATKYVAKSICDYCKFHDSETNLYKLDGSKINNINNIEFNDNIDTKILQEYLLKSDVINNILISDGLFDDAIELQCIAIVIGIDANRHYLKKSTKKVFEAENIISAIEYLSFLNDKPTHSKIEEDDEDEW